MRIPDFHLTQLVLLLLINFVYFTDIPYIHLNYCLYDGKLAETYFSIDLAIDLAGYFLYFPIIQILQHFYLKAEEHSLLFCVCLDE